MTSWGAQNESFTATLTGSSAPITWSLTGSVVEGSLSTLTGSTTTWSPPLQSTTGPHVETVTAQAGTLSASCQVNMIEFRMSGQSALNSIAFIAEPAIVLSALVNGTSDMPTWTLESGPGSLTPFGTNAQYLPPAVGSPGSVRVRADLGRASRVLTIPLAARLNRGGAIFAFGRAPLVTTNGQVFSTNSFNASGPLGAPRVTRTALGTTTVQVDGLAFGSAPGIAEVTPVLSTDVCTVSFTNLDSFGVACRNASGAPVDAAYDFRVTVDGNGQVTSSAGIVALGMVLPNGIGTMGTFRNFLGAPITTASTGTGLVAVTIPGLPSIANIHITAVAEPTALASSLGVRCSQATRAGDVVTVACVAASGAPVNAGFSFSVAARGTPTEGSIDRFFISGTNLSSPTFVQAYSSTGLTTGVALQAQSLGIGNYAVSFLATSNRPTSGVMHVSAFASGASCVSSVGFVGFPGVSDLTNGSLNIRCVNAAGAPVDTRFQISLVTTSRPSAAGISAFTLVRTPTISSTPAASDTYNSTGGAVSMTRASAGTYTVSFTGQNFLNANVQVSAFYSGLTPARRRCATAGFQNADVFVRCFDASGNPADAQFFVTVANVNATVPSSARVIGYSEVLLSVTTPTVQPATSVGNPTVVRSSSGRYTVTFPGFGSNDLKNLQVMAQASNAVCNASGYDVGTGAVQVDCDDGSSPIDSAFSVAIFAPRDDWSSMQRYTASEVLGFVWLDQPSTSLYMPYGPLAYNPSGGNDFIPSRFGQGVYSVVFTRQAVSSGVVQLTTTTPAIRCAVWGRNNSTVEYRCFDGAGALADAAVLVSFLR